MDFVELFLQNMAGVDVMVGLSKESSANHECKAKLLQSRVTLQRTLRGWEKVGLRCNDSTFVSGPRIFHYLESERGKKYVITVDTL